MAGQWPVGRDGPTGRHSADDKFLDVAVDGGAELIVTGDADILVLHPFEDIEIITPAACLARVGG